VSVTANRFECEQLRCHVAFQVEHQSHHRRHELPDTHLGDVGVIGLDLGDQFAQRIVQRQVEKVDHQPGRIRDRDQVVRERLVQFQRDSRVVRGGPDPDRENSGASRQRKIQRDGGCCGCPRNETPASEPARMRSWIALRHRVPRSLPADSLASRASPG
jgi:hypothetical protein